MKPGYKTSEFWITILLFVLSAVWGSGLIGAGTTTDHVFAFIAATAGQLGYTLSRGIAKAKALPAP